jgi:LacI family transcriptional regulator
VREDTALRVLAAAESLGYHATGLLKQRIQETPLRRLGFLLQKRHDEFYKALGAELASATREAPNSQGRPVVEFMDEIVPSVIAERIVETGAKVDALAVVAVDHPLVNEAIAAVTERGKPVVTLLSDVTAPSRSAYVSVDSRSAGRTAAWAIARLAKPAGKIGILLGSHRYLSQDLAEISFRSYMREHAPQFQLLEPLVNLDDERIAYEAVVNMVASNHDLVGLYMAGGGAAGMIRALREEKAAHKVIAVCNELVPATRAALIDGIVDLVLATPITTLASRAVDLMLRACNKENLGLATSVQLPASLFISENI